LKFALFLSASDIIRGLYIRVLLVTIVMDIVFAIVALDVKEIFDALFVVVNELTEIVEFLNKSLFFINNPVSVEITLDLGRTF